LISVFLNGVQKNAKFEALNPKFETSTNSRNPNGPNEEVLKFENWKFGFVSDFELD